MDYFFNKKNAKLKIGRWGWIWEKLRGGYRGKYDPNTLYKILKELINIFKNTSRRRTNPRQKGIEPLGTVKGPGSMKVRTGYISG